MIVDLLGWFASFCFAFCACPQAVQCFRQKHANGVNATFMWVWLAGELSMIPYIILKYTWDWPIMFNLTMNTLFILVILYYMYFPKETNAQI